MTTSGTYLYNPSLAELSITAFGRIGVRRTEILASHMADARNAANLVLSELSNLQPNLWEVGLTSLALTLGTATYNVNAEIVMILDLYISTGSPATDRPITPVSRTEYASYPNKTQQGAPTVFWFDRLTTPTLTFWPVPDASSTYTANYYSVRQTQDANLTKGQNVEIPYRFLEAFTAALAWKLAEIYRPEMEQRMQDKAERAWRIASTQDTENVPIYVIPGMAGYYR